MPRKNTILANVENSQNSQEKVATENAVNNKEVPTDKNDDDDAVPIQVAKTAKVTERVKRPQTEAQKAATAKMRQALADKWEKSRSEKKMSEEQRKKQIEEKVVKKAIAVKKKQIKQQMVLDEISSDDEPIEEIIPKMKKVMSRQPPAPAPIPIPQGPKIIFM